MPNNIGRVVKVHPGGYSVDLLMLDDGARLASVQVISPSAGTDFGQMDMVEPELLDKSDRYKPQETKKRDIYAIVGYAGRGRTPFVQGFLFPQVCQMLFKDINRRINRHPSDVYSSIDKDGNLEVFHPSGTYFRIGTDPQHEDLTEKDFDKKWKITRNTDRHVHVHLEVKKEGETKATVNIDPDGNVALTNQGTLTSTTEGDITVTSSNGDIMAEAENGNATLKAKTTITLDAPTVHVTGDLNCDKTVTGETDVVGGGKHLKTHAHGGGPPPD